MNRLLSLTLLCALSISLVAQTEPNRGGSVDLASKDLAVALERFTLPEGYEITCFASEHDFPLGNPVAQAFDARGRLWVLCMPTYPQIDPREGPAKDRIVILEDTDGDGKADKHTVFADGLHVPTGFELGDGGAYVAAQPDLLFLKDTDGDDVADVREIVLHGFGTEDSHHALSAFAWTPGGALVFQEGTFHHSQVETPWGPTRLVNAGVFRFEPRSERVKALVSYGFANPWGHVYDRWGQNYIADASGGSNYFGAAISGHMDYPKKHRGFPSFTDRAAHMRPTAGAEFISSRAFPEETQGHWLLTNCIGFRGIRQYEIENRGSGVFARKVHDLLSSSDPNFRPVHVRFGPDGALYVADWWNPLIGHMQYSLRDPRRDHVHGRIWRITHQGKTIEPARVAGASIDELVALLAAPEDETRYRARLALREQPKSAVLSALDRWLAQPGNAVEAAPHKHLEALWVRQHHHAVDEAALESLLTCSEPRARAAAVRVVRFWRENLAKPLAQLARAIEDPAPRVRLEAIVALSDVPDARAVEIALKALDRPLDNTIEYALRELVRNREPLWTAHLAAGRPLCADHPAGARWLLGRAPTEGLLAMARTEEVIAEVLKRDDATTDQRLAALTARAEQGGQTVTDATVAHLLALEKGQEGSDEGWGAVLGRQPRLDLQVMGPAIERLVRTGTTAAIRQAAVVGHAMGANRLPEVPFGLLTEADLLTALPDIPDARLRDSGFQLAREAIGRKKTTQASLVARHVRIELPGEDRTLALAEVEVIAGGKNVARGKNARQASVDEDGPAARAVDGLTDTFREEDGEKVLALAHSEPEVKDPWWEVDLGSDLPLDSVRIWNRSERHLFEDLDGFTLVVLDAERRPLFTRRGIGAPEPGTGYVDVSVARTLEPAALRDLGLRALAAMPGRGAEVRPLLLAALDDEATTDVALDALLALPPDAMPADRRTQVTGNLLDLARGTPHHQRLASRFTARGALLRHLAGDAHDAELAALARPMTLGAEVYGQQCIRCHMADGKGAPGAFPPLVDSPWLDSDDERQARIVLHGLSGPIEVSGVGYDAVMEPLGALLDDEQVAAVLTYVRNRFGKPGPAVDPATVARVREAHAGRDRPWDAARLLEERPLRKRTRVVFVTGDEEYRSEESMPMLARILERDHGFEVFVCYALNEEGRIDPNTLDNIEGLGTLEDADMMVLFTRFRRLPDDQAERIIAFADSGKPMVGFRTSTHAFRYPKDHPRAQALNNAWPQEVFGQRWITHHGHFGDGMRTLTATTPVAAQADHPVLRGVEATEVWSWLYHVDGNGHALPSNALPLVTGKALASRATNRGFPVENPVAWTRTHRTSKGQDARVFFTTLGHPYDFRRESIRKLALNGILWALGMEDRIPATGSKAHFAEIYAPANSGFGRVFKPDLKPIYQPAVRREGIEADRRGRFDLPVTEGKLTGDGARFESLNDGPPNLGYWVGTDTGVRWKVWFPRAGTYTVRPWFAVPGDSAGAEIRIGLAGDVGSSSRWKIPATGAWGRFERQDAVTIRIPGRGTHVIEFQPVKKPGQAVCNLRGLELRPR